MTNKPILFDFFVYSYDNNFLSHILDCELDELSFPCEDVNDFIQKMHYFFPRNKYYLKYHDIDSWLLNAYNIKMESWRINDRKIK